MTSFQERIIIRVPTAHGMQLPSPLGEYFAEIFPTLGKHADDLAIGLSRNPKVFPQLQIPWSYANVT